MKNTITAICFLYCFSFYNSIFSQPSYYETNKILDVKLCEWRCAKGFDYNGYNRGTVDTDDIYIYSGREYRAVGTFKWDGFWNSNYTGKFEAWIFLHGSGKVKVNKICITDYGDNRDKEYCNSFYKNH